MEYKVFGCKVNKFYLNRWLSYFKQHKADSADKVLVATCVVTDRAKAKRVKDVTQRLKEWKSVYLTGCGAFDQGHAMDYERFWSIYPSLKPYRDSLFLLWEDPQSYPEHLAIANYELNDEYEHDEKSVEQSHTKANLFTKKFIVIQSGCDTYCTFCLTIYKRGSNRNREQEEIVDEIKQFVDQGGKEIVITGVNLAAWGTSNTRKPKESKLTALLEQILQQTRIERIRISSLGPEFLSDDFFALMDDRRFLPHFHFSIQSFSDTVLRLMNRNYDSTVLDRVLTKIRKLDRIDADQISIGADIIVGFPGESEQDFRQTFDAVEQYGITKLHAFPFSAHQKGESVPAGKLSWQVDQHSKKERERLLLAEGDRVRESFLSAMRWKPSTVLLESYKDGARHGWSENYIAVEVSGDHTRGDVIPITL